KSARFAATKSRKIALIGLRASYAGQPFEHQVFHVAARQVESRDERRSAAARYQAGAVAAKDAVHALDRARLRMAAAGFDRVHRVARRLEEAALLQRQA